MSADTTIGYIIAGGASRRLGGKPKGFLDLSGRPVLARVMGRLKGQVDRIVINTNLPASAFTSYDAPIIADAPGMAGEGPLAGLLTCLRHAAHESPTPSRILTVPWDCPFLPLDLVSQLSVPLAGHQAAVAVSGEQVHAATGLWRCDLVQQLRRSFEEDGMRSIRAWAEEIEVAHVKFPTDPYDPLFNINTPEDFARAEELARRYDL